MAGILMIAPMVEDVMARLDAGATLFRYWEHQGDDAWLEGVAARVQAIATTGHHGASAELMAKLPALQIVACYGVGYDAIDVGFASAHGIKVTNTPDVLTDDVADMALGLMLAICRRIPQADRFVRDGNWRKGNYPLTERLGGKRCGIVGLGRIGKAIARRAEACGMHIAYHGRNEQPGLGYAYYADLIALARDADYLVAVVPGGGGTDGLISRQVLEALGPKGTFVNIARGSIVDEPALVELLQSGGLGAAALDVFADEPRVPEALLSLDNVVLSPHQGSATHHTRWAMGDLVVRNLEAHFAGQPLLTPVN